MAATALVADSIARFDREQWDRCFPGEPEGWDYYKAAEDSRLAGFELCYPSLWRDGQLMVVAPAFFTEYRLDTTVTGAWKRWTDRLSAWFPKLLSLPMACLGSPVGEVCRLGRRRIGFIAVKDAPDRDMDLWSVCLAQGYQRIPSLPTATLAVGFDSLDGYLSSLSRATRKNMKRKMRAREQVAVEWRRNIDDVLPEVMEIYRETLARSDILFEELTPDYFRGVLERMGDRAHCVLYWTEGRLAGFNLVLRGEDRLLDKFIGLRHELGRKVNLYFLSWLTNVEHCIDNGIGLYVSGQMEYATKKRLGSRLQPNWLLFRHRSPLLNRLLRVVGALVRIDRHDPDVADLIEEAAP